MVYFPKKIGDSGEDGSEDGLDSVSECLHFSSAEIWRAFEEESPCWEDATRREDATTYAELTQENRKEASERRKEKNGRTNRGESHEARYLKEANYLTNNGRGSHTIRKLSNLIRDNDDFYELVFSKFLSEN